jgi:hypothetical protein
VAGFDTAGAYDHAFGLAFVKRPNRLQVGIKASLVNVMGMADVIAHHRFFPADLTFF